MTEADIEVILERAKERYPRVKPRIISDNLLTQECSESVRTKISRALVFQARLKSKSKRLPQTTGMALDHSDTRSADRSGLLCT